MFRITERMTYDGADHRIQRLGLGPIWGELTEILTGFRVVLRKGVQCCRGIEAEIDKRFRQRGWISQLPSGINWAKSLDVNTAKVCLGVRVKMTKSADELLCDIAGIRDSIDLGFIDVAVLVVPADYFNWKSAAYTVRFNDALTAVERLAATTLPLVVLGLRSDGMPDNEYEA